MRRKEREVKNFFEITEIIGRCRVCRIGFSTAFAPYILPLNFGFFVDNENITLYFHCANQGKKLDLLAKNPLVGWEMDCSHALVEGDEACNYSMKYESVIGSGIASVVDDFSEKEKALTLIMKQYSSDKEFSFPEKAVNAVTVFKIEVSEYTAKRYL